METEELYPDPAVLKRIYSRIPEAEAKAKVDSKAGSKAETAPVRKPLEQLRVGVLGLTAGAGASLLTLCLAGHLAATTRHTITVAELYGNDLYDSLGLEKRFAGRTFTYLDDLIQEPARRRSALNVEDGINWMLQKPGPVTAASLSAEGHWNTRMEKLQYLIHSMRGEVVLFDLSGEGAGDLELLQQLDHTILVIDPMPSRMMQGMPLLQRVKQARIPLIPVVNRMNPGVMKKEMIDFLRINHPLYFPALEPDGLYQAQYHCKSPYRSPEVKKRWNEPLTQLTYRITGRSPDSVSR